MINPSALNPSVDTSIINIIPSIIDPEIKSEYNTRVSIILGYRIIQKIQHCLRRYTLTLTLIAACKCKNVNHTVNVNVAELV